MAADLHRDAADFRLLVTVHGLLEGPPPFLRDGLPPDLEVHIIAVIPAAVGAAGLIGEGRQGPHKRVLGRDFHRHPQQVELPGPVHEVLVERAEMGQLLRRQRGVPHPLQGEDHRPGLLAHRVRRRNIGHLAGGVAFQVLVIDGIDRSGAGFHGATLLSSVLFQIESPYTVGELPGGKAVDLPVNLHLPDLEGMVLVIDWVFDFYPLSGGLPVVVKDVHTKQFALTVWAKGFIFPCHVMPHNSTHLPTKQQFYSCCKSSIKESKCLSHDSQLLLSFQSSTISLSPSSSGT